MKHLILSLIIRIPLSACASGYTAREPGAAGEAIGAYVTAVSYNIRIGIGSTGRGDKPYDLRHNKKDLPAIISALRSIDPDVVGLQEVLGGSQAKQIATALDMNYAYTPHKYPWWGVAILSKYPIIDCDSKFIGYRGDHWSRAIACRLGTKDLQIAALSIHRQLNSWCCKSTKIALDFARKFEDVIFVGDFNFGPGGPQYDDILETFYDTGLVDTALERPSAGEHRPQACRDPTSPTKIVARFTNWELEEIIWYEKTHEAHSGTDKTKSQEVLFPYTASSIE